MSEISSAAVRLATEADLPAINEIYNYYVPRSTCTYQLEPETDADRAAWFQAHPPDRYPAIVAEDGLTGQVIGWGSLSPFRPRAAYKPTVELSVYIHHQHHRRGLGLRILEDLIERAKQAGYRSLIAGISADQTASIALHQRAGFKQVAYLVEAGYKFDRWLDVVYLQLMLS